MTTTQTAPPIGKPLVLAPLNGPTTLDGMSRTTIAFDDGLVFTIAGWSMATYAPDADGVMRAQLTGWLTDRPKNMHEKMTPDYEDEPRPLRVVSGHPAGHEPLDGKLIRRVTWSVGAPFDGEAGKSLWDHPGEWVTLRWIHAIVTPDDESATAAPTKPTFADLIERHKTVIAVILGDGEKTDLGELTPQKFIDHIDTVTARLSMSPTWYTEREAALIAHGYLSDAVLLDKDAPERTTLLCLADDNLKQLGDESDWIC